jgi:hypothetical protein
MPTDRPTITDPTRLRALSHPLRWRLLRVIGDEDTATATRCAEVLDESVASCSYHLNMLAKYGFIEQAEGGRGREKPWRQVGDRHTISGEGLDDEGKLAAEAAGDAFLEQEFADIRAVLRGKDREPKEWRETIQTNSTSLHLTAAEANELRHRMAALTAEYEQRWDDAAQRPSEVRRVRIFTSSIALPRR